MFDLFSVTSIERETANILFFFSNFFFKKGRVEHFCPLVAYEPSVYINESLFCLNTHENRNGQHNTQILS